MTVLCGRLRVLILQGAAARPRPRSLHHATFIILREWVFAGLYRELDDV